MKSLRLARPEVEQTIGARFAQVAGLAGARVALRADGRSITYAELDQWTRAIAGRVEGAGVPAGGCVAFLAGPGAWPVAAALGIQRAGRVSLALSPALPPAGQDAVLEDARPDLLLAAAEWRDQADRAAAGRCPVTVLPAPGEDGEAPAPAGVDDPDAHAVIYYTSGSTGAPKGVVKSHRAVLHRAWFYGEEMEIQPGDRTALLTAASFAASESDTYGALLNGLTLCPFDVMTQGLPAFREWLEREAITLLHPPVQLYRRLLAGLPADARLPAVRALALAGETVRPSDLAGARRHFDGACRVLHRFSATETGVLAVGVARAAEADEVPAGRPVPDKELSLDADGVLVACSRYLASGYWRRPQETAEAFRDVPGRPGWRSYRTGDRGHFGPDGGFVPAGRVDDQVKIRGYRVELREVEAALSGLPGVREAAVVARRADEETALAGFVVPAAGAALDVVELRAQLAGRLPAWQVPARLAVLESLPLTSTGKVDRVRLAEWAQPDPRASTAPADTELETRLAGIWSEVLRRPVAGGSARFFDLAGSSLDALVMLAQVERAFGVRLAPAAFLRAPRLDALAAALRRGEGEDAPAGPVVVRAGGPRPPLYLLHSLTGDTFWSVHLLPLLAPDRPVSALHASGAAGVFTTLPELAADYARQVDVHAPPGVVHLLGYSFGGRLAYETARQLRARGRTVGFLGVVDSEPAVRRYGRDGLSLRVLRQVPRFLLNLPFYLLDQVLRVPAAERRRRFRRKWKSFREIVRQLVRPTRRDRWDLDPAAVAHVPPATRALVDRLVAAARVYEAEPYEGGLHLIRTRARNLFRPAPADYGWGRLARGGVRVVRVAGSDHATLLRAAIVPRWADAVNLALREGDAETGR